MKKSLYLAGLALLLLSAAACNKNKIKEKDYPKIVADKWQMDSVVFEYYNFQTNRTEWYNQVQSNDSVTSYSVFETGGKFYQVVHYISSGIDSIRDDNYTWSVSSKNLILHVPNGINLTYDITLINNHALNFSREQNDTARSSNGTVVGIWKSINYYHRK